MSDRAGVHVEYLRDEKVVRGKHGRLFIDADTNRVLDQHAGKLLLTPEQLEQWRRVLEQRAERLAQRGIPYFFLVPPNPHSLYPEDLPDGVPPPAAVRPVLQLMEYLESRSSFRLGYPLELLVAAKERGDLIVAKTDSHWSSLGAYLAYRELADQIGTQVPMRVLERADMGFEEIVSTGDLGFKVEPMETSPALWPRITRPARLVSDNLVLGTGTLIVTECDAAPESTCLVFGDSFTHQLLAPLSASFRRMVFAQLRFHDENIVEAERPDVVVGVLNERFLIQPPVDDPSATIDGVIAAKPPRMPVRAPASFWD